MPSINFERSNNELILCYSPSMRMDYITHRISFDEDISIKRTFWVNKSLLREGNEYDYDDTLRFCIGEIGEEYTKINNEVIDTDHKFYFSNNIELTPEMFIAYRNISILRKIDDIINGDFYVGGNWEKYNGIPMELYMDLVKRFPKTAELDKYAESRIANILKEHFPECDKYVKIYEHFMENRNKSSDNQQTQKTNLIIEHEQFSVVLDELESMLLNSEGIPESVWQKQIQEILQLIYPKYILCTREISFKGIDGYDKRPDFVLVDSSGFVDVLEIKKPDVQILTKQASYRNNYVPVREFAGAIQQIEKYIFCLSSLEKSQQEVLGKLDALLPDCVTPEIVNPQGILILGRSLHFDAQQKRDFELIKRQYKNITDIMTYDDLAQRLKNIIAALEKRIQE